MPTQVTVPNPGKSTTAGAVFQIASLLKIPSPVAWMVGLGLGLRLYHYLRNPGVWLDELFVLRNVVGKGYLDLLGPLTDDQAAPPLFLWLERTLFLLFGDGTLGMRLLPLIASCGALLLLIPVARRLLSAEGVVLALLLFAFSDKLVDHTIEVKQYLLDTLVAVAIPALYVGTRNWPAPPRFFTCAVVAPVVIFASYPGCFFMGGLMVALLPDVWDQRRSWAAWLTYTLIALTTFAAFGVLVAGPIRAQHTSDLHGMWTETFPDWANPWMAPWWSLHAFVMGVDHAFRPLGRCWRPQWLPVRLCCGGAA
jgi:hypothetical protein